MEISDLRHMSARELRDVFRAGTPFSLERLVDAEYIGVSLGLPPIAEKVSWTTFMKAFYRDGDILRGWNVRLEQTGIGGEVRAMMARGKIKSFGHFAVRDLTDAEAPLHAPATVLLDYKAYRQPPPIGWMRDPLVSLDDGVGDRLLGYSYAAVAGTDLATPSFFVLERYGDLRAIAAAPRRSA